MDDDTIQDLKQSIITAVHSESLDIRKDIVDVSKGMSSLEKKLTKKIDKVEDLTRSIAATLTSTDESIYEELDHRIKKLERKAA